MSETVMNWYVMIAISGKEAKVREYIEAEKKLNPHLAENIGEILIPMEKTAQVKNGKRVVKEKTALPGYVFVQANLVGDIAHTLRFTPNVLGFIGGLDKPSPVKQEEINRMLGKAEANELEGINDSECPYIVGDAVKVTDGPFSGFSAEIKEINTMKKNLKVEVTIFGRKTPLELGYAQVEKE